MLRKRTKVRLEKNGFQGVWSDFSLRKEFFAYGKKLFWFEKMSFCYGKFCIVEDTDY